jgi:ribosomal protein S18 acetylase RimI-like enzyme
VGADDGSGTALRAWADTPGHVLLVGTLEEAVVGIAVGHAQDLGGERIGVVDCLYVEPQARGVGVGSALTAALVSRFGELGCVAVDAPALPGDRETKQRFEAAGFSARLLVLHRRLP